MPKTYKEVSLKGLLNRDGRPETVVVKLEKYEYATEYFTSTRGRVIEGPATIRIERHADGGIDIHISED